MNEADRQRNTRSAPDPLESDPQARLLRPVVLVGMMGAGKTAVGRELAQRLGVEFRDSDAEIEKAANATITEIFARDGEAFFRDREVQVIARLLEASPSIIAVGGGAYLREETRARISKLGVAVWLKADLELLWSRVRRRDTRPLLRTPEPRKTLADLMAAREGTYALAEITVETRADYSVEATALAVCDALAREGRILSRGIENESDE